MNIFILSTNIERCARYLCDKHVVKMGTEAAQMLSTAHWFHEGRQPEGNIEIYKPTHQHHQCSVWARKNEKNYLWLCDMGLAITKEYTYRYDKVMKTESVLHFLKENVPESISGKGKRISPFVIGFKQEEYIHPGDVVKSYRNYYRGEKSHILKYKRRPVPHFLMDLF